MSTVQQNPQGSSSLTASSMVLADSTHQAKHYLIMVDAQSKWPEVIGLMKTTTADSTINAKRNIFARYGLPAQVVSDNGPPFQSAEYEEFLRQNGIQRILVSPYHPSSNGLAERFVQTFRYGMQSSADDPASSIQRRIQNFLSSYRSTPHATTGSSPARLFLQRGLRSRLSLVTPDIGSRVASQQDKMKCNHDKFAKFREIAVGDCVLSRDHLSGQKWQAGTVVQQTSPASFQVQLNDGRNWRRHVDDVLSLDDEFGLKNAFFGTIFSLKIGVLLGKYFRKQTNS